MRYPILILLGLVFLAPIRAQIRLNRMEKKILKQVATYESEAIDFLEKVVNINSGTLNQKGVREVGNVF